MRLNKFIALHSKYSRREADRLILDGAVKINHTPATHLTSVPQAIIDNPHKTYKDFKVFIHGRELHYCKPQSYTAIVYHKPKGELVSKKDERNRKLIYDSLGKKYAHFMPVGRLDFASEGLLILSDSKEVVRKLMESHLLRVYLIKIDSPITQDMITAMQKGIVLHDARLGGHHLNKITTMQVSPMTYTIIKNDRISKLKVGLKEGKNRELRRFFAHFNANVLDLKRVSYGFIHLNHLPVGKMRFFTKQEYTDLKEFLYGDSNKKRKKSTLLH